MASCGSKCYEEKLCRVMGWYSEGSGRVVPENLSGEVTSAWKGASKEEIWETAF